MDRDGTKDGYDLELTRAVADAVDVPVIASGGVGGPDAHGRGLRGRRRRGARRLDLPLRQYTVAEVKAQLAAAGVPVRLSARQTPRRLMQAR